MPLWIDSANHKAADLPNFLPFNTLHRYMLGEITRTFILCVAFLLALILLGRGVQMRELMVGLSLGVGEFLLVLMYMSPMFLLMVIPLSCMLSVFLTTLRMSGDRELVALRAGGVSVCQLLPAPLWFAAICCLATLGISLYGIAWGSDNFRATVLHLAREKAQVNLQPGVFNHDISGMTMFARQVDPATKELRQVIVEDSNVGEGARLTILAPTGRITTDNKQGELVFNLHNGRIYKLDEGVVSVLNFGEYNIRIDLEKVFKNVPLGELRPREMSWGDLLRLRDEIAGNPDGRSDRKALVEIQKRFSFPAASLVLALFAVPLAAGFQDAKRQTGLILALAAFLLYYSIYSLGITLAEAGRVPPAVAMWTPNAVFLLLGVGGMILASREGSLEIVARLQRVAFRRKNREAAA